MLILISISIVISLIIIILLCAPKTKEKTNLWYAAFLTAAGMGYPVAILRDYIIPATHNKTITLISYFLAALSYRFSPYFLLMAGMSYSNFIKDIWKNRLKYITLIPCFATFILDFIYPSKGFLSLYLLYSSIFWTVSIWAIPYGIIGVLFFIHAYFTELNSKRRKFKLFVILINLPVLGNILIAYGATTFNLNGRNMWVISLIPAIVLIYFFIFYAYKHGIFGIKIKLEPVDALKEKELEILSVLTEAEKEVALLKLRGKTNQEIAEIRSVTLATVKSQINDIHKKLNIRNIDELKQSAKSEY